MDLGIAGKAALVTASSKGLGRAVAEELACEGARLAICSRDASRIAEVAEAIASDSGARVIGLRADVSRPEEVKRLIADVTGRLGGLDILVTNAGGPPSGTFETITDNDWENAYRLNLASVVELCRAAVPHMKQKGWGRIVNITSIAVKEPVDGLMLSNSLRAAVVGFAKTLSREVASHNILVNNVCPGFTMTERVVQLSEAAAERRGVRPEDILKEWEGTIPLGRIGTPPEFASLVAFLASERASYITGTTIPVDGGAVRGLL